MPKVNASPEAILEAIKKVEILSELLEEKNKNNLKMIAEGKLSGGKQIGPYARLLTYAPVEVIVSQGDWGGNTFNLPSRELCWSLSRTSLVRKGKLASYNRGPALERCLFSPVCRATPPSWPPRRVATWWCWK